MCEALDLKITNNLENCSVLTIHCRSKNDDLGIHALPIGGIFEFHFEPRFLFPNTQFYCSMDWIGTSHYFVMTLETILETTFSKLIGRKLDMYKGTFFLG
ncbi:s-protein like protein 4 [Quercus suber]|uniref:S-protein homolog n=1 Tax=Quercus suber TaxID=58331 RepID=A0AAW0LQ35_QUESU